MNQSTSCNSVSNNVNIDTQTTETKLKFKKSKKFPVRQLPFVDKEDGKAGLSFWSVPKTGGYAGGNITGRALALLYLKHLRANGPVFGGLLQSVVLDMFDKQCDPNNPALSSLRGQAVGFFTELEKIITVATAQLGSCLDSMDEKDLLKRANGGINLNEDDYTRDMLIALSKAS